jgi:hypothetical protein
VFDISVCSLAQVVPFSIAPGRRPPGERVLVVTPVASAAALSAAAVLSGIAIVQTKELDLDKSKVSALFKTAAPSHIKGRCVAFEFAGAGALPKVQRAISESSLP